MYIFIDFETYYNSSIGYTLKAMSIEEYVRDERFAPTIVSIAIDNGPVYIVPAEEMKNVLSKLPFNRQDVYTVAQNAKFDMFILSDYFGIEVANPICTRAMARWVGISRLVRESQASICEFLGTGVKGTFLSHMDGRSMDHLTPEEYKAYCDYCISDTHDMRLNTWAMLPLMTQDAMDFIAMSTKMYSSPIFEIDVPLLETYYAKLEAEHEASRERIQHLFQFDNQEEFMKAIRSAGKFSAMLEKLGGVVPMKLSQKKTATRKRQLELELAQEVIDADRKAEIEFLLSSEENYQVMTPALAKNDLQFMALMDDPNPDIAVLCSVRAANNSSIAMSRAQRFMSIGKRGTLAIPLEPFIAITGRYSGGRDGEDTISDKINLQNLAKRAGDKTLRKAIRAPAGYKVVAGDSSQCEVRVGAYIAREQSILDTFATAKDTDNYCNLAARIYGGTGEEIMYWAKGAGAKEDPVKAKEANMQRNVGKEGILSSQYGAGGKKFGMRLLQQNLHLSFTRPDGTVDSSEEGHYEESQRIVGVYRSEYRNITAFWKECMRIIEAMERGESGFFGGPDHNLFFCDGAYSLFNRVVPCIVFPDGYRLFYPNLRYEFDDDQQKWEYKYDVLSKGKPTTKRLYGGALFNNLTQGLSFAILRWQALQIRKDGFPIHLNVHDEWSSVVPDGEVQSCIASYERHLRACPEWAKGIPFDCECGYGQTYGDV